MALRSNLSNSLSLNVFLRGCNNCSTGDGGCWGGCCCCCCIGGGGGWPSAATGAAPTGATAPAPAGGWPPGGGGTTCADCCLAAAAAPATAMPLGGGGMICPLGSVAKLPGGKLPPLDPPGTSMEALLETTDGGCPGATLVPPATGGGGAASGPKFGTGALPKGATTCAGPPGAPGGSTTWPLPGGGPMILGAGMPRTNGTPPSPRAWAISPATAVARPAAAAETPPGMVNGGTLRSPIGGGEPPPLTRAPGAA
mmetsp:Transcript_62363/g.161820  ORF Transcript_62363/g.161820 Transcript_62363/m.161820 type:complete len:254 (+) Transcript_62363:250-1011(+)